MDNCLSIGLSANFVEPLEATSIGTSINQVFLFMHYLSNYNDSDIEEYNSKVNSIMNNIKDFIFLHYMVDKNTSQFWRDVKKLPVPETLQQNLEKWKYRLPIREDFNETEYYLFFEYNFTSVLHGLGKFNLDNIRIEYESLPTHFKDFITESIKQEKILHIQQEYLTHKEYLDWVRAI